MHSSLWVQTKARYIHSQAELNERFESGEPGDKCVDYLCILIKSDSSKRVCKCKLFWSKDCTSCWQSVLFVIDFTVYMYINFKGFQYACMQLIVIKCFHDALFSNFSFCLTTHQRSCFCYFDVENLNSFRHICLIFIKYKHRTRASWCCLNWGTMLLLVLSNQVSSDHNNIAMLKNTRKRLSACVNVFVNITLKRSDSNQITCRWYVLNSTLKFARLPHFQMFCVHLGHAVKHGAAALR